VGTPAGCAVVALAAAARAHEPSHRYWLVSAKQSFHGCGSLGAGCFSCL
jgi:hypothetical protein